MKVFFRTEARMGNIINLKKMMSAAMFAAGLLVSRTVLQAQQAEQEAAALLQLWLTVTAVWKLWNCMAVR